MSMVLTPCVYLLDLNYTVPIRPSILVSKLSSSLSNAQNYLSACTCSTSHPILSGNIPNRIKFTRMKRNRRTVVLKLLTSHVMYAKFINNNS